MTKFSTIENLLIKRRMVIAPGWQEHAASTFFTDIESQVRSSKAEILKDDSVSTVVAVPFNASRLVVKQYHFKNVFKFLKRSVRRSYAQKTWNNALFLSEIGIQTVKPVALIEDRLLFFKIRSFFVGTYIPGQEAPIFFNNPCKAEDERRTAAQRIVDSLCDFHSRGVFIGDTKGYNIIVGRDAVCWVDLEALSRPWLKWLQSRKAMRDWRVLFYNWKDNDSAQQLFHQAAREKLDRPRYWKYARIAAVYRKKKFSFKEFQSQATVAGMPREHLLTQVNQIAKGNIPCDWERVASSRKTIVARKNTADDLLYCKIFLKRNRLEGLKKLFRGGRGARMVRNERMLQAAGFLVPETLYWGTLREKEFTLSRGVNGISILLWLKQPHDTTGIKRKILRKLGEEVASLHRVGFAHGDLRMSNILLEKNSDPIRFFFIDNERTRLYRKIPRKLIFENLRQLNTDAIFILSRTDRLRILKAYLKINSRFSGEAERDLIIKIERMTREWVSRKI